jgi:hypothetical protein
MCAPKGNTYLYGVCASTNTYGCSSMGNTEVPLEVSQAQADGYEWSEPYQGLCLELPHSFAYWLRLSSY